MYIVDTTAFYVFGNFYPSRFPSLWDHISKLVTEEKFWSVKEVRQEIEHNCPFDHIETWVGAHRNIFRKPTSRELEFVAEIFKHKQYLGLVKRSNILKGLPVADPFIIAAGKVYKGTVVTQESFKDGGARIPTACKEFAVSCINVEQFMAREKLKY
jgi:hypothetical protein